MLHSPQVKPAETTSLSDTLAAGLTADPEQAVRVIAAVASALNGAVSTFKMGIQ